jgi:hypothetical protein
LILERGNFSAIYPGLVYGGETRFTRQGVDVMPLERTVTPWAWKK